jgi:hypothetical protein
MLDTVRVGGDAVELAWRNGKHVCPADMLQTLLVAEVLQF